MPTSTSFFQSPLVLAACFLTFIPVAIRLLFIRLFTFQTNLLINAQCAPSSTQSPLKLDYTGLAPLDDALCSFVAFFHASMGPDEHNALTLLIINICPIVFAMFVESSRNKSPKLVSFPVIWGIIFQIITLAITMPIYWLSFLLGGGHKTTPGTSHGFISQERAEAIVFGFVAGCIVPSAGLIIFKDPQVTAIWQIFPVYTSLAVALHHFVRPSKPDSNAGHRMILMTYAAMYLFASSYHIALVLPMYNDGNWKGIQALLLPVFRDKDFPADASLAFRTLDFFKADVFIASVSSLFATLWFGSSPGGVFVLAFWALIGSGIVGPGASFCAVMCWREFRLERLGAPSKKPS